MLSRFFRRKASKPRQYDLSSDDRNARLEALAGLNDPSQAELAQIDTLAAQDPDVDVRRGAIARSVDLDLLARLLEDPDVADSAARRIVQLEPESRRQHPKITAALLASGVAPQTLQLAGTTPEQLVELLIASRGEARSELLALPALSQPETLTLLERQSRNRDKSLNRFAREHLDRHRQHQKDYLNQQQRLEELLAALEKHLRSDATAVGFRDKHQQLLDRAKESLAGLERSASELDSADATISSLPELQRRLGDLPEPSSPTAADHITADPFIHLSQEFTTLATELRRTADFSELQRRHHALTDQWLAAADLQAPNDTQHALFQRVSRDIAELSKAHQQLVERLPTANPAEGLPEQPPKNPGGAEDFWRQVNESRQWLRRSERFFEQLRWPQWAEQPEHLNTLREQLSTAAQQLSRIDAGRQAQLETLTANLAGLNEKIANGESKAAQSLLGSSRALLKQLPRQDTDRLSRSLNQAAAALGELKDWQTFATTPKRQTLCDEMTSLAEQPLAAADQASRIKLLREQWNELGPATSKADHDLADQFNALAERAFEPCRAFFAQQAQQREENLKARVDICEQLSAYLESTDWSHTDIKAAEQIMRTARAEWQRFHPVERKPGKPLEERFETLQNALHNHIRAEWDRNLTLKQQIVADAAALLEESLPVATRVATAKDLQQRWRSIGPTPRRPDQQLWQEFRGICDQIFESRETEKRAADAETEAARTQATQLLDTFAASLNGALERGALRQFQQAFSELPALPPRIHQPLQRRAEELQRQAEGLLKQQATERRRQELATRLREDSVSNATSEPASEADLRRQVIEAEIAAELESDPADRQLRIAIQVELMNQGRGQQALSADPEELVERWLALGTKPPGCEALVSRFEQAIGKLSDS